MGQTVYVAFNNFTASAADLISDEIFVNRKVLISDLHLTTEILVDLATQSKTDYFFIIFSDISLKFSNHILEFKPEEWDSKYVHIWDGNDRIRLYNKYSVLKNPESYLVTKDIQFKNIEEKIYTQPVADIVFMSYDEPFADENYNELLSRFPRIKRVHGVKGIYQAHKEAGLIAKSSAFYVVDADAKILSTFDFNYYPNSFDSDAVHVWRSKNPINDLEYGYGGVKMFPTLLLNQYQGSPVDFTTSISSKFKPMPEISNITRFNTDPFSTWRSAFRECVKLASKTIEDDIETEERLNIWCTIGGDREFGDFAIIGANEGRDFGQRYKAQPEMLRLINDYEWLSKKFSD